MRHACWLEPSAQIPRVWKLAAYPDRRGIMRVASVVYNRVLVAALRWGASAQANEGVSRTCASSSDPSAELLHAVEQGLHVGCAAGCACAVQRCSWMRRWLAVRVQVEVPAELQQELMVAMGKAGIPVPESPERWARALGALKARAQGWHGQCWPHGRARMGGTVILCTGRARLPRLYLWGSGARRLRPACAGARAPARRGRRARADPGRPPPPTAARPRAQGVWASKYNARALLSMRKVGLDFRGLRMAVLVQRVVPAAYAFVIHTRNPATGAPDEARPNPTLHQA